MKALIARKENKTQWLMVAMVAVLLVALMIPGLAWADHASDDPIGQYDAAAGSSLGEFSQSQNDALGGISAEEFHQMLVQQFIDGALVRYAPGR